MAQEPARRVDYTDAIARFEQAVRAEMAEKSLHGIAVALVDGDRIVHSAGFGTAKKDSIFRAGSISKLFNATAIMQLVEQGKLDLDAPIQKYGAQFSLVVPFDNAPAITLRQLLCHRSGMIRESPVGGYFDGSQPSLADTVASIRSCVLVNPPNTKTRYSNIGPSIGGQILVTVTGTQYPQYQQEHLFAPMGMNSSAFLLTPELKQRVTTAFMRVSDGQGGFVTRETPMFELGTIPAGNLYTTAEDLARFLFVLGNDGRAGQKQIISPDTLKQMFMPQLVKEDTGFGLGFMIGKFRGRKSISHMGAVYGYTSSLAFLPESKIGVIILSNDDIITGPIGKLSNKGLSLMVEAKLGEKPPAAPDPVTLSPAELTALCGEYESQSYWARLEVKDGKLVGRISGQPVTLTPVGPLSCLIEGNLADGSAAPFERSEAGEVIGFTAMGQKFTRVKGEAAETPALWKPYLGSYGPDFIPLVLSMRNGHLYAMTENMVDYRLTPVNRNVFAFPPGMYVDEHLVMLTGADGKPWAVNMANMLLPRRER